jgi:ACS family sodium-dependent inorganic phosphate cotransporter-like MFS transporter 6/7/8
MSFDEIERPPLRKVDKYVRAECPCIKTARFTIAFMTCLGFIISFGMRCNMGMAKLQRENMVSWNCVFRRSMIFWT